MPQYAPHGSATAVRAAFLRLVNFGNSVAISNGWLQPAKHRLFGPESLQFAA
jgi:hypothetical protein